MLDDMDQRLLNDWQRDMPLLPRPFAMIGQTLGLQETAVIARLKRLKSSRAITRVGATVRPNTIAVSTLAAMAVPEVRIDEVAALIGSESGINHSYLREHHWNLWFVATAPDAESLQNILTRIRAQSELPVLDLPLLRAFNIDLGFNLNNPQVAAPDRGVRKTLTLDETDRRIMQAMSVGLPLTPRPFAGLANELSQTENAVVSRIKALSEAGYLTRVGVIVRHRTLGWNANAMVVWRVPVERIVAAGTQLATLPGITLCYQRETVPETWPYTLYSMIHARSRAEAQEVLERAKILSELSGIRHEVLFSTHCFKQTGAMIAHQEKAGS